MSAEALAELISDAAYSRCIGLTDIDVKNLAEYLDAAGVDLRSSHGLT